jgi:hypothetical protein
MMAKDLAAWRAQNELTFAPQKRLFMQNELTFAPRKWLFI